MYAKSFYIRLNNAQINNSENDAINTGDLYLSTYTYDSGITLGISFEDIGTNSDGVYNKIAKIKNLEALESLFAKVITEFNGRSFEAIFIQCYLEFIFTINLEINNCFGQSKCPNEYEIGVIVEDEFYGLNCLDSCLWKAQILTTSDIFNFKTLHYTSFSSDVKPIVKQFNISETLNDCECEFKKETNETFALICDFNTTQ